MAHTINQLVKTLSVKPNELKLAVVEDALKGFVISPMTDEKDKEIFLRVATVVKATKAAFKTKIDEANDGMKPKIREAETVLEELKTKLKDKITPYKSVVAELDRIDVEARNEVSRFVTEQMKAAEEIKVAPAVPGKGPVFMPVESTANKSVSFKGHDLKFTATKVVKVDNLNDVPENFVNFMPNDVRVREWLLGALHSPTLNSVGLEILSDGRVKIVLDMHQLPKTVLERISVKNKQIIEAGGCAGVTIVEEQRPVVR